MLYIIVPYRSRLMQLELFTRYTTKLLNDVGKNHKIIIVEQANNKLFNRGCLLNCGLDFIKKQLKPIADDLIIISDIDCMCPYNSLDHYTKLPKSDSIRHIYGYNNNYRGKYYSLGTVISTTIDTIYKINGYPNNFWGWGAEDLALSSRAKLFDVTIDNKDLITTDNDKDFYELPNPKKETKSLNKIRTNSTNIHILKKEVNDTSKISNNGLSTLKYSLIKKIDRINYTLIKVNF